MSAGSPVKRDGHPFPYLEDIHIFVISQIIRRPIIILSDPIIRSLHGHSLAPNTIHGVYLPVLWDPKRCCKSPVVLGYLNSHFVPLLPYDDVKSDNVHMAAPLVVGQNMERLPVRLLKEKEEASASKLLLEYLEVIDIRYEGRKGSVNSFQAAKITPKSFRDFNIVEEFFKKAENLTQEEENKPTSNAKMLRDFEGTKDKDSKRKQRRNIEPLPLFTKQGQTMARQDESLYDNNAAFEETNDVNTTSRNKCVTKGCQFYGQSVWLDRCSECYKKYLESSTPDRSKLLREGRTVTSPGFRHSAPLPSGEKPRTPTSYSLGERIKALLDLN